MAPADVTLLYRPGPPARYVARFGHTGWCEGWGWKVDEALDDLAGAIEGLRSSEVPPEMLSDRRELARWLRQRSSDAVLDP